MPLKFKAGDKVRQIVKPIEGVVTDAAIIDVELQFRVDSVGPDGEHTARFFKEDEIALVPAEPAEAVEALVVEVAP